MQRPSGRFISALLALAVFVSAWAAPLAMADAGAPGASTAMAGGHRMPAGDHPANHRHHAASCCDLCLITCATSAPPPAATDIRIAAETSVFVGAFAFADIRLATPSHTLPHAIGPPALHA